MDNADHIEHNQMSDIQKRPRGRPPLTPEQKEQRQQRKAAAAAAASTRVGRPPLSAEEREKRIYERNIKYYDAHRDTILKVARDKYVSKAVKNRIRIKRVPAPTPAPTPAPASE